MIVPIIVTVVIVVVVILLMTKFKDADNGSGVSTSSSKTSILRPTLPQAKVPLPTPTPTPTPTPPPSPTPPPPVEQPSPSAPPHLEEEELDMLDVPEEPSMTPEVDDVIATVAENALVVAPGEKTDPVTTPKKKDSELQKAFDDIQKYLEADSSEAVFNTENKCAIVQCAIGVGNAFLKLHPDKNEGDDAKESEELMKTYQAITKSSDSNDNCRKIPEQCSTAIEKYVEHVSSNDAVPEDESNEVKQMHALVKSAIEFKKQYDEFMTKKSEPKSEPGSKPQPETEQDPKQNHENGILALPASSTSEQELTPNTPPQTNTSAPPEPATPPPPPASPSPPPPPAPPSPPPPPAPPSPPPPPAPPSPPPPPGEESGEKPGSGEESGEEPEPEPEPEQEPEQEPEPEPEPSPSPPPSPKTPDQPPSSPPPEPEPEPKKTKRSLDDMFNTEALEVKEGGKRVKEGGKRSHFTMKGGDPATVAENMIEINNYLEQYEDTNVYVEDDEYSLREFVVKGMFKSGKVLNGMNKLKLTSKKDYIYKFVTTILPQTIALLSGNIKNYGNKNAFTNENLSKLKDNKLLIDFMEEMLYAYLNEHHQDLPDIYDEKCQEVQARCCKEREDMLKNLFTMTARMKELQLNELKQTMKGVCAMNQTTDSVAYSQKLGDTVVELAEKAILLNTSVPASTASSAASSANTTYSRDSFVPLTPPTASASSASSVETDMSFSFKSTSETLSPVEITKNEDGVDLFAIEIFNKAADAVKKDYKEKLTEFKIEQQVDNNSKIESIKEIIESLLEKTSALTPEEKSDFKARVDKATKVDISDKTTTVYDSMFTTFMELVELLFTKVGKQREELEQKLIQYKNANNSLYKFIQSELPGLEANEKENEGLVAFIKRVEQAEQKIGDDMAKIVDTTQCPKITDKQYEKCQQEMKKLGEELAAEQAKFATKSDEWSKSREGAVATAKAEHVAEMEALREQMEQLTATNNTVVSEKEAVDKQLVENQQLLEEKLAKVESLTKEVTEEKSRLERQEAECKATVQGLDAKISQLETRLKEVNTQTFDNEGFVKKLNTDHQQALAAEKKGCEDNIANLMGENNRIGEELARVTKAHEEQLNKLRDDMSAETQDEKRKLLQKMDDMKKRKEEIEARLREADDERRQLQQAAEAAEAARQEKLKIEEAKQAKIDACLDFVTPEELDAKVVPPITGNDFEKTVEKLKEVNTERDPPLDIASVTTNGVSSENEVVKNLQSFWKTYGNNTFKNKENLIQLLTLILNKKCNETEIEPSDLLKNKRFSYLFTILSVFILKKFEIFVGAIDKSDEKQKFTAFKCMTQEQCVTQTIDIGGNTYKYDNVYLPMGNAKQYYVSATEDCKAFNNETEFCNSLYNVREITGLIDRFTTETGTNNYLLFNYGFSGTGKTNVASGIIRLLTQMSTLAEIKITHGVLGKFLNKEEGFKVTLKDGEKNEKNSNSAKGVYGRGVGKNKYSNLDKTNTFSTEEESFSTVDAFKQENTIINNTVEFDLYKKTMNNKRSSRFHMYYKFTHKENSLYFFDLAGSENSGDIFANELMKYTRTLSEADIVNTLLGSKDSVYKVLRADKPDDVIKQLVEDHMNNSSYMIKKDKNGQYIYTDLFRFLTKEKITKELKNGKPVLNTIKRKQSEFKVLLDKINGKEVQRELHILLESFYINYSLHTLQNELVNYNESSEYKLNAIPAMGLPEELQDVKKIYMFGFIRNDKLDGAKDTLDFLDKLKPMMGSHPIDKKTAPMRGGGFLAPAAYVGTKGDDEVYDLMANATMDRETTTWFVEVIAIVVLKILRVMYYEKAGNSGRTNEQFVQSKEYYHHMMKEYVATLSLSAGLYLAGRTRMFYAVMTDLIMSAMIMLVTKNEKLTMFPLFLAVYLTDFN